MSRWLLVLAVLAINIVALLLVAFAASPIARVLGCVWLGLFLTLAGLVPLGSLAGIGAEPTAKQ